LIFPIRGSVDGTQETVNPAFFVYREWLLYVKIWDWYRVCSFLRLATRLAVMLSSSRRNHDRHNATASPWAVLGEDKSGSKTD
jgi:hypothetical protein